MREIILDTETTGLDPATGHRIVEIGALELLNHVPTGSTFHVYLNPERDMPPEAQAVHGLSAEFLRDKPLFKDVVEDFLTFVLDSPLIIHNASFDMAFINAELSYLGRPAIPSTRVVDSLQLARQRHPMGPNSLDALCKRYGVDLSRRTKHGALLDSELLAEVYIELIGGRQTAMLLAAEKPKTSKTANIEYRSLSRPRKLTSRLSAEDRQRHAEFVLSLGAHAIWHSRS
ncbi:MAG: DNA polymerase III subunit epsilon [Alphaproteobacteria bacterium]|nr:DNA polymerase III subunit epsilon [Alphaproteobacteria bacterium]